ncbi:MAG: branched-chain amino acid ABC transporter permease, partial [Armatimonadota bacterium]|nr:branched-chain amino acid ABC transporter permease [Armatimonadota bacterium]
AGVLVVPVQQAHYLMGLDVLLLSFVVVILGGLGSLGGTVVASLLVGWMDGFISLFFTPTLARILATLVVALVLVVRRGGLWDERAG